MGDELVLLVNGDDVLCMGSFVDINMHYSQNAIAYENMGYSTSIIPGKLIDVREKPKTLDDYASIRLRLAELNRARQDLICGKEECMR